MKIMLAVVIDSHEGQITSKTPCEVTYPIEVLHFKISGQKHCIAFMYKFGTKVTY